MTSLDPVPSDVAEAALQALEGAGHVGPIRSVLPLSGGSVHPAVRIELDVGPPAFLKWSRARGFTGFGVEARGLEALANRGDVRVPQVISSGAAGGDAHGWLLLEYIDQAATGPVQSQELGSGLARLHEPLADATPGWEEEGWIGPLRQENATPFTEDPTTSWPEFWRDRRLLPRWSAVADRFDRETRSRWDRLMTRVDVGLAGWQDDGLAVLHGDLWSGNVLWDVQGAPVLIDPAVYRGHREVDIAMMELFGGFVGEVFEAYDEEAPIAPCYGEVRRDLYQLYPLLVHVALFGGAYVSGVHERILRLTERLG